MTDRFSDTLTIGTNNVVGPALFTFPIIVVFLAVCIFSEAHTIEENKLSITFGTFSILRFFTIIDFASLVD